MKLSYQASRRCQHLMGLKYAGLQSFPIPVIWEVGWVSSETVEAPGLQVRGLEIISTAR